MFDFFVKYLGFLKNVPLLPQLFEAFLILCSFIFKPEVLDGIDIIHYEVLRWEGITECRHKYGGLQFDCSGKEVGHIHGNGILDILFSKKIKEQLLAEGKIKDHHIFANTGWISFYITQKEDAAYAIKLLWLSWSKIDNSAAK
ncbi:luciferase family protein [uncultured Mucilaginibacter sp.]|uniref:luciferase domain-containing protein n=1 Tax=uncultured Mucilaginibacter sp. TaxID=797541 RepID=UPI0026013EA4|nr:luciferase family protein [uncultured Mucilaginibacter sp.]